MRYLLAFLVLASVAQAQTAAVITNGLVAWYPMENPATERINALNGTLVASPGFIAGRLGNAVSLNGSNQYVTVAADSRLTSGNAFTVAVWIRTTTTGVRQIAGIDAVASNRRWALMSGQGASQKIAEFYVFKNVSTYVSAGSSRNVCDGAWHHVAATFNGTSTGGTGTPTLYVDGLRDTTVSGSAVDTVATPTEPLWIGARNHSSRLYFAGQIDSLMIWSRVLSAQEVALLATFKPYGAQ